MSGSTTRTTLRTEGNRPLAPSMLQFIVEFFQGQAQLEVTNSVSDRSPSSSQSPPSTASRPTSPPLPDLAPSSQQKRKREEGDGPSLGSVKKTKINLGDNPRPSMKQGTRVPCRTYKQVFLDISKPTPKPTPKRDGSFAFVECTGQSNRKELLDDDERRQLAKMQKEARKSLQ
ncbi:hypothetical protein CPB84DRAFT_1799539 [Gymnopilus junonius]|uniref:Uncharacterized protein n=1 Tax=Gymnopilus junonius TaxID=109634 RepID=A0A9P5N9A1_GYMJU|nr:hypothetical protein CPB84DRAFT_1799539 [Gymnopilus junonius]